MVNLLDSKLKFYSKEIRRLSIQNTQKKTSPNVTSLWLTLLDPITVTLWENKIAEVEPHCCYHFKELKLNCYNKKYLGSSTKTMIQKCESIDIPEAITSEANNLKPNEKAKKSITGTILAVEVKKIYICINCKSKIPDAPDTAIVKCPNCNLKIKKCELISTTTANIMIKEENGENM